LDGDSNAWPPPSDAAERGRGICDGDSDEQSPGGVVSISSNGPNVHSHCLLLRFRLGVVAELSRLDILSTSPMQSLIATASI
jgi:hypothetical protein